MTSRPDPHLGTDLGPYRIERVIGRGGMGVVYLAEDQELGRRVALKLLPDEVAGDADFRARFERESRLAASLDHPNIIPIFEAGELAGTVYLAMRYVEGTDLAAALRDDPPSPDAACQILMQVATALDAAHARGLVHRDVKPANVLLDPGAGDARGVHAYLTDFGLTKEAGSASGATRAGTFLGTLAYMAPEQVDGREVGARADEYSLAAMAFEALAGHVPFQRAQEIAVAMAHLKDPPPSAVSLRPSLPPGVDAVLARGLAKDPEARYPTCAAFVAALLEALSGQVVVRRYPRASIALALSLLAVAGIVGGSAIALLQRDGGASGTGLEGESEATPDRRLTAAELSLLGVLPPSWACVSGPYDRLKYDSVEPARPVGNSLFWVSRTNLVSGDEDAVRERAPSASLRCMPGTSTPLDNATEVTVRQFDPTGPAADSSFTVDTTIAYLARTRRAPAFIPLRAAEQVCEPGSNHGRWVLGAVACYAEADSGTAVIYWSYDAMGLLVKAINTDKGGGAADRVVSLFETYATRIGP